MAANTRWVLFRFLLAKRRKNQKKTQLLSITRSQMLRAYKIVLVSSVILCWVLTLVWSWYKTESTFSQVAFQQAWSSGEHRYGPGEQLFSARFGCALGPRVPRLQKGVDLVENMALKELIKIILLSHESLEIKYPDHTSEEFLPKARKSIVPYHFNQFSRCKFIDDTSKIRLAPITHNNCIIIWTTMVHRLMVRLVQIIQVMRLIACS